MDQLTPPLPSLSSDAVEWGLIQVGPNQYRIIAHPPVKKEDPLFRLQVLCPVTEVKWEGRTSVSKALWSRYLNHHYQQPLPYKYLPLTKTPIGNISQADIASSKGFAAYFEDCNLALRFGEEWVLLEKTPYVWADVGYEQTIQTSKKQEKVFNQAVSSLKDEIRISGEAVSLLKSELDDQKTAQTESSRLLAGKIKSLEKELSEVESRSTERIRTQSQTVTTNVETKCDALEKEIRDLDQRLTTQVKAIEAKHADLKAVFEKSQKATDSDLVNLKNAVKALEGKDASNTTEIQNLKTAVARIDVTITNITNSLTSLTNQYNAQQQIVNALVPITEPIQQFTLVQAITAANTMLAWQGSTNSNLWLADQGCAILIDIAGTYRVDFRAVIYNYSNNSWWLQVLVNGSHHDYLYHNTNTSNWNDVWFNNDIVLKKGDKLQFRTSGSMAGGHTAFNHSANQKTRVTLRRSK